jgi:hypothetical protein
MKILPVRGELFVAAGRTNGLTDMTKANSRLSQFRETHLKIPNKN